MLKLVEEYGFKYSRRGCSCNGSPYIYIKRTDEGTWNVQLWPLRLDNARKLPAWHITHRNQRIAAGVSYNELQHKLQELWD
ncbi:MAG: hypothetical protein UH084_08220 [Paludibacteraceae bacterium]|nr:hypothetical protein [Paludibacteraceae bacterium]